MVASQSGWACFFSASVALADTLGHTGVPRCTRLLFHHQCHLKANQTRRQDPLEYNALCVPAQDAHPSSLGLSSTTPSRFKLVRPRSTHSLRSGVHDAVRSKNRRRVHQEPLGQNTRLVHHCHTTVAVWKPSTTVHARLCGRDPDKAMARRRLPGDHKFSLPDSQPLLPSPSPPPSLPGRNVRQLLRRQCRVRTGR